MRPLRLAAVLVAASLLTACVSTAGLGDSEPSDEAPTAEDRSAPPESAACASYVDGFEFAFHQAFEVVRDVDLTPDVVSTGRMLDRAAGSCAPPASQPQYLSEACGPAIAAPGELGSVVAAGAVEYMFHAGAVRQVSGAVTARTEDDQHLTVGFAAWRFGTSRETSVAPLLRAVTACPDADPDDDGAVTIRDGDEPHVRVTPAGVDVFSVRSARVAGPDGATLGFRSTGSGLLSEADFDAVDAWWRGTAEELLGGPAAP